VLSLAERRWGPGGVQFVNGGLNGWEVCAPDILIVQCLYENDCIDYLSEALLLVVLCQRLTVTAVGTEIRIALFSVSCVRSCYGIFSVWF
jgi:hypothetical protein